MSLQMIEMTQDFATAWGNQVEELIGRYLGRVGWLFEVGGLPVILALLRG